MNCSARDSPAPRLIRWKTLEFTHRPRRRPVSLVDVELDYLVRLTFSLLVTSTDTVSASSGPIAARSMRWALELDQVSIPQDLFDRFRSPHMRGQIGSFTLPWQYCHFEFI